jgi:hypothetical protein
VNAITNSIVATYSVTAGAGFGSCFDGTNIWYSAANDVWKINGTLQSAPVGVPLLSTFDNVQRDLYANIKVNNTVHGYATTATAAGTTTLTVMSAHSQYFSGTTTQTVLLPVVTTLVNGFEFKIVNNSTGIVTVQSSGTNQVTQLAGASAGVNRGGWGIFSCIDIAGGTGVASWSYEAGATIL